MKLYPKLTGEKNRNK